MPLRYGPRRRRIFYLLESPLRRRALVLVPVLVAATAAGAAGFLRPARYRAAALVGVEWDTTDDAALRARGVDVAGRRLEAVRGRVTESSLLERAAATVQGAGGSPASGSLERLRSGLRVRVLAEGTLALEYVDTDPAAAALVASTLAKLLAESTAVSAAEASLGGRLVEARRSMQEAEAALAAHGARGRAPGGRPNADAEPQARAALDAARAEYERLLAEWQAAETKARLGRGPVARVSVMRLASLPRQAEGPAPWLHALAGAALGLLLGLAAALVAELRDSTVKGPEDLQLILPAPVLAIVPEVPRELRE
jgi:uncharacterized protein involved in exopolysaccharide biosynthesis